MTARDRLLALGRSAFKLPPFERLLLRATSGHAYSGVVSKLPPNPAQYRPGEHREVERHGLRFRLDRSDLIQWYLFWGFIDPSHDQLVALCRSGMRVVDVGANMGVTVMRCARAVGPTGEVIGFEPDPLSYARAIEHLEINHLANARVEHVGLSDEPGTLHLEVPNATNRGMTRVSVDGRGIEVPVTTLDEQADLLGHVDLIKIDVEGHEERVLRGAEELLRRDRPVLFMELSDSLLQLQGSSAPRIVARLDELGYVVRHAETAVPLRPDDVVGVHHDVVAVTC